MSNIKIQSIRILLRSFIYLYSLFLIIANAIGRITKNSIQDPPFDILLTGMFFSKNWIFTHLRPLAGSNYCKRVRMVAIDTVPIIKKVDAVYPPLYLVKLFGKTPARILLFIWTALRYRPQIIGGFHMIPNGLTSALVAPLIGAKSLYFCGGGFAEISGGGYLLNPVFAKLEGPDNIIEKYLFKALSSIDITITMGKGAIDLFTPHADSNYYIVPGGFDPDRFYPSDHPPDNDLILIGYLSQVKRVDIFLEAIKITRQDIPDISAIIVGGGPLIHDLKKQADELGLNKNVKFVGHQDNVEEWLRRSKIFVLTSDTEGVSQAMIQAMLCGLSPVVSDVGDLGDLVTSGENGYLIRSRTPYEFAKHFKILLQDEKQFSDFRLASTKTVDKYKINNVSRTWDKILKNL